MDDRDLHDQFDAIGADWELTKRILDALNGPGIHAPPVEVKDFPPIDGDQILDLRSNDDFSFSAAAFRSLFPVYFPDLNADSYARWENDRAFVSPSSLDELGLRLSQYTAFGVLNGGMATSYGDSKKNQALGIDVFRFYQDAISRISQLFQGQPKGITPAFFQSDLTPGPSFLELKFRHLAQINFVARKLGYPGPGMTFFQMTSPSTDAAIRKAYERYSESSLLEDLADAVRWKWNDVPGEVQSLVGTFSPADSEGKRRIFTVVKNGRPIPYALPGGHGQNFRVLKPTYRDLESQGYRFAYIGNVDNLGFLPSLRSLAILALKGAPAAFDFSFKTAVDVKGGVLYRNPRNVVNCADIGVAISASLVDEAVSRGQPILFNCATGVFQLRHLNANIDTILDELPVRISDQDKDVGKYSQAELVTWEAIGILDRPLILGIEKSRRFLAAKLLIDCLLTSGYKLDDPIWNSAEFARIAPVARSLSQGLERLLSGPYSMKFVDGHWIPMTREEIERRLELEGFGFLST